MAGKIVIANGVRTPFVRANTYFTDVSVVELGRLVVAELIARANIEPHVLDSVIIGNVAQPVEAVNVARVIALRGGIPEEVPAFTVHRNCASGMQSVISASQAIKAGDAEIILAGGVESMTNIPFFHRKNLQKVLTKIQRSRTFREKIMNATKLRPGDFIPRVGLMLGLTDPVCHLNMGQTAEVLARELGIGRDSQDEFALTSHLRTAKAQKIDAFSDEIMAVITPPAYTKTVSADNGVRPSQSIEALTKLKPFFDEDYGSVTAGNSSQITDGAAAVLVASEAKANELSLAPLGYIKAQAFAGLSPKRMGLGPAYSTTIALKKAGLGMADIGIIEMNEAFAAQVIANEKVFASDKLSERYLNQKSLGAIDRQIMNVNGGAIAMGHPVGATGTRMILTTLLEMQRRKIDFGLTTLCIGGGQGAAIILERAK